jgi:hypothetical protein
MRTNKIDDQNLVFGKYKFTISKKSVVVSEEFPNTQKFNFTRIKPAFDIRSFEGRLILDIKNNDSLFFRFLQNSSITDKNKPLTSTEYMYIINKILAVGYLLHDYKDPERPWVVSAIDHSLLKGKEKKRGSGKSLFIKSFLTFKRALCFDAKAMVRGYYPLHIPENIYDYIIVEDIDNSKVFYPFVYGTTDLVVEEQGKPSYNIPREELPKFIMSTDFIPKNLGASERERLLFVVFTDYYNKNYTIKEDLGKHLFHDYNEAEWNADINFFIDCLQFYLSLSETVSKDIFQTGIIDNSELCYKSGKPCLYDCKGLCKDS